MTPRTVARGPQHHVRFEPLAVRERDLSVPQGSNLTAMPGDLIQVPGHSPSSGDQLMLPDVEWFAGLQGQASQPLLAGVSQEDDAADPRPHDDDVVGSRYVVAVEDRPR